METFNIEVQEFLARVVEVEALSSDDAISKISEMYDKAEIVLDYNDFVDMYFLDIDTQSKKDEKENLVNEIIEYLFETEKKQFEESETKPEDHIYNKLLRLKELNSDLFHKVF